ncbi:hypothetical protein CH333_06845 [candidate division WOR-3 bacterium JGI_Cruoil_03_44_89]|uniref:Glycosyltransferase 2-like domain-containing protein n=1 Tax=candidate division WOR-3 bacterium JGI_Cruoil_03_44_89 TaxID=1973748 RepID=A0A235BR76_UNCW3|nr:MAG: hypothetical protein CH333_06845 [candidate division WOR-3 bacterium JGI_Cruoil_03_44_89]
MKISVVIPVNNEAATIADAVDNTRRVLADRDYEIVVVDDCSNDSTYDILKQRDNIKLIRHLENKGVGGRKGRRRSISNEKLAIGNSKVSSKQ